MNRPSCPPRQVLLAYQTGELTEATAESVISHVTTCVDCQAELATMDKAGDPLVESLRAPVPAEPYANEPQLARMLQNARSLRVGDRSVVQASGEPTLKQPPRERLGEYELLAKLGEGGMGAVYRARQTNLDRLVALKVLPKDRSENQTAIARFYREMRAVGRLSHPNIVQAFDAREIDGSPVLAMEYVDGLDLSKLAAATGALSIADACELIRQAAVGLQHAHEQGLVHRDIKPSNLMLNRQATVKILDLGLALLGPNQQPSHQEMTSAGTAMGTADYVSPEQATDSHSVDIRADIYSLGCTLYKLLTGRAPFADSPRKTPLEVMLSHLQKPMPSVRGLRPDVPEKLALVIERMTAKSPSERFATPAEVAAALEPFAVGCDLVRLLSLATQVPVQPGLVEPTGPITDQHVSSAMTGTTPRQSSPVSFVAAPIVKSGRGFGRRRLWIGLAAAAAAIPLLFGVWAIVRDKSGKEVGRIQVPEGGSATLVDDQGKPATGGKPADVPSEKPTPQPADTAAASKTPQPVSINLTPEPLDMPEGSPLSKMALVAQPSPIPGVRSWTMETIAHRGSYTVVAYSPDGRWLATSCSDETIRLWDPRSEELKRVIVAHDRSIAGICWSPDSRVLASASADGTVRLWDPDKGQLPRVFRGEKSFGIAWSPDGRYLAAAIPDAVRLWKFGASEEQLAGRRVVRRDGWQPVASGIATRKIDGWWRDTLAWCDHKRLVLGSRSNAAFLADVETEQKKELVPGRIFLGMGSASSIDRKTFVCTGDPPTLWDTETGQLVREFPAHISARGCVAFSPDGKNLAGNDCHGEHPVAAWEVATGKLLFQTTEKAELASLAYSPNGEALAGGLMLGSVNVWNATSGQSRYSLPAHRGRIGLTAWSPDARSLVAGPSYTWDWRPVEFLDTGSGAPRSSSIVTPPLTCVRWGSQSGSLVLAAMLWVKVAHLKSGKESHFEEKPPEYPTAFDVSPDGKRLAVTVYIGNTQIWDTSVAEAKLVARLPLAAKAVAFSPQGELLAVGSEQEVKLCDSETGEVGKSFPAVAGNIRAVAWSPNGKTLVAGAEDKKLHLFDVESKRLVATCEGHTEPADTLGWADGGKTLISGNASEVCVWDPASGKLLRTISDDGGAISADGRLVASRGESAIRLRQIEDGKLLQTIVSLRDKQYAAISPDGHFRGSPDVEQEFVYVVQTDQGQETFTPEEFSKRYGWKNDPSKALRALQAVGGQPAKPQPTGKEKPEATGGKKVEPGNSVQPEQPAKPPAKPTQAAKKAG